MATIKKLEYTMPEYVSHAQMLNKINEIIDALPEPKSECHCGKEFHAVNSINCPVHGYCIEPKSECEEKCSHCGTDITKDTTYFNPTKGGGLICTHCWKFIEKEIDIQTELVSENATLKEQVRVSVEALEIARLYIIDDQVDMRKSALRTIDDAVAKIAEAGKETK